MTSERRHRRAFFDYSLSLIPDDTYADEIRDLSVNLGLDFGDFQPHITVLPLDMAVDFTEHQEINLRTSGYYCNISVKQQAWHGLKLQYSEQLMDLRQKMANYYKVDLQQVESYFPHITLGCTTPESLRDISLGPLAELNKVNGEHSYQLQLCRNGDFGKVVEIIQHDGVL